MKRHASLVALLCARADEAPDELAYGLLESGARPGASLTYAALERASAAVAAALAERVAPGERALLVFAPGLDFVPAFFGCLRAGVVAVPAFPPSPAQGARALARLAAIAADCAPRVLLTTRAVAARIAALDDARAAPLAALELVEVERLPDADAPARRAGALAFLQYTSGSTAAPKGVRVTHANVLANLECLYEVCGGARQGAGVSWLPVQHDMGLVEGVLHPLYRRRPGYLMSPAAFLARPLSWLEALSGLRATNAAAPDFGYQLCVRRTSAEERAALDLSSWRMAANGAEPVHADTLERFCAAFAPAGFRPEAFYPAYGLAENTLFVASSRYARRARVLRADADALDTGDVLRAASGAARARALVSCGTSTGAQEVRVVDPASGAALEPGRVGELWVRGPSVADGYWGRPVESERAFGARMADGSGPWLRTGDLGALHAGEVFVTGRIKDVVVLRGRKLYPQDVERTVEACHPLVRPGGVAALALATEDGELLGVVCELRPADAHERLLVERAVRAAVAREHDAQVGALELVVGRRLPKTTSGKIQRHACAALFGAPRLATRPEVVAR
jgi:acyl-CoA synthetase (AMP-forming)/AMP-acid ligase II